MTVKELREALAAYPDDTPVVRHPHPDRPELLEVVAGCEAAYARPDPRFALKMYLSEETDVTTPERDVVIVY